MFQRKKWWFTVCLRSRRWKIVRYGSAVSYLARRENRARLASRAQLFEGSPIYFKKTGEVKGRNRQKSDVWTEAQRAEEEEGRLFQVSKGFQSLGMDGDVAGMSLREAILYRHNDASTRALMPQMNVIWPWAKQSPHLLLVIPVGSRYGLRRGLHLGVLMQEKRR